MDTGTTIIARIENLMVDRQVFGIIMVLSVLAIARVGRLFLRDVLMDDDRRWQGIARIWLGTVAIFLVWTSILDNWLQMAAEPYRLTRRWASQRIVDDPVGMEIRTITIVLMVAAALFTAAIFARHIGGYGLQIVSLVIMSVLWVPFFVVRQRLDILVHDGVSDVTGGGADFAGLSMFWLLRTAVCVGFILLSFIVVTLLLSPFVTFVLDLLKMRTPPDSREANEFFSALHRQANTYDDVSLKARWRPIERPL